MARVLFVSKPVVPPWNDSSKNLARDVAMGLSRHSGRVMSDHSGVFEGGRAVHEPVYRTAGRFAPGRGAQLRVLRRLALGPNADLWHFFFAPNPKSSLAGRALAKLRRTPTVQTVCSRPRDLADARRLLFADRTVVLSTATHDALIQAGVGKHRLAHIPPAVPPLTPLTALERTEARAHFHIPPSAPVVVYPGDLELGEGASRVVEAFAQLAEGVLVMACRAKTAGAADAERALREDIQRRGLAKRVIWVGETNRIHDLLGCADVVALPSSDLYAKMDLPLVLLEAMWLARPVVVAEDSPAAELTEHGALPASTDPESLRAALERAFTDEDLGPAARRAVAARFGPERMVEAYEAVYDAVLEERG